MLKQVLARDFVPHLPPLIDQNKPADQKERKDLSRALSAFALSQTLKIEPLAAAQAVIDDFEDCGIDAVLLFEDTLYLVQAKLRAGQQVDQADVLKFINGVKQLMRSELGTFNEHVQRRTAELFQAIQDCREISLMLVYVGDGVSQHAATDLQAFIADPEGDEGRYITPWVDYGPQTILNALNQHGEHPRIDFRLGLQKARHVTVPHVTYFGLVKLSDLVALYNKHGIALFDRNIRNHVGDNTPVNISIRETLATEPGNFFYYNNGVTGLASTIEQKNSTGDVTTLQLRGFSVVNGAQTIASAAGASADIATVRVALTIVQAATGSEFGKRVTETRNNQNALEPAAFAALDDVQEKLRRDLKALGFRYHFKSEPPDLDPKVISYNEAVIALALRSANPRMAWRLAFAFDELRTRGSNAYVELFSASPEPFGLINGVVVWRTLLAYLQGIAGENDTYRHGRFAFAWVMAKRLRETADRPRQLDGSILQAVISAPVDTLRESLLQEVEALRGQKPAWAVFRNQTDSIELLERLMLVHYGIAPTDAAVVAKRGQNPVTNVRGRARPVYDYPQPLFSYLATRAPQIVVAP